MHLNLDDSFDFNAYTRLDGRGIVVLGTGGDGIGAAVTRMLAAGGAQVLCVDILQSEAERMAALTGGESYVCDFTDRAQVKALFEYVDRTFGDNFHGFVSIIGGAAHGALEDFDDAAIEKALSRNLLHAVYAAQYGGPLLRKRGHGSMVFISSLAGEIVAPGFSMYGAGKAALNHFMKFCADEFGPAGVRANVIGTGQIQYGKMEKSVSSDNMKVVVEGTALRRTGRPIEMAGAVYFLMSDMASYVTGHVLHVDGGRMIGMSGLPRSGAGIDVKTGKSPVQAS